MAQPVIPGKGTGERLYAPGRSLALLLLGALPCSAYAYLDPGSGSLLIQAVLALVFAFTGLFKRVRTACAGLLRRLTGRRRPDES
jgi:hypothetical protein